MHRAAPAAPLGETPTPPVRPVQKRPRNVFLLLSVVSDKMPGRVAELLLREETLQTLHRSISDGSGRPVRAAVAVAHALPAATPLRPRRHPRPLGSPCRGDALTDKEEQRALPASRLPTGVGGGRGGLAVRSKRTLTRLPLAADCSAGGKIQPGSRPQQRPHDEVGYGSSPSFFSPAAGSIPFQSGSRPPPPKHTHTPTSPP